MTLDTAVRAFLRLEREASDLFMQGFADGPDAVPTLNEVAGRSVRLWFAGLKRWGRRWPEREYELREEAAEPARSAEPSERKP